MNQQRKGWLGWLLASLIILAVVGGFAFYRPFNSNVRAVAPAESALPKPELDALPGERLTFLVMGVDNIDGEFGRADSMVIVSYDPKEQRLAMLSVPRDIWTQIPGHGYDKINHAYAYGGHELAIDTVERTLGIDINHWVTLSFEGFMEVIDAVGGVEIDVPTRLYYDDPYDDRLGGDGLVIDIEPGLQTMDGLTALKYARFRADEEGDVGRMRRQQEVIQAVIKKAATPAILARVPQLIPAMYSAVGTDMSVAEMLKLAAVGREALAKPLKTGSLSGEPVMLDGVFYFAADLAEVRTAAYEVLVGTAPDAAFLSKARQESIAYKAALEEALADSSEAAHEGGQGEEAGEGSEGTDSEGESGEGDADPNQPADGESKEGEGAAEKPGDSSPASQPAQTPAKPSSPAKSEAVTVAVVDATGAGLYKEYVQQLRAAGFRVARVTKSPTVVKRTVLIDHAGKPEVEERLKAIFPELLYVSAPDPRAEQALEIILGEELVPPKN